MTPLRLRADFDAGELRALAKVSRSAGATRRLLALAEVYDGGSRTDAARIGSVGLQTIRDWVLRFNARGPERLVDGKAKGQTPKLSDELGTGGRVGDRRAGGIRGGPQRHRGYHHMSRLAEMAGAEAAAAALSTSRSSPNSAVASRCVTGKFKPTTFICRVTDV